MARYFGTNLWHARSRKAAHPVPCLRTIPLPRMWNAGHSTVIDEQRTTQADRFSDAFSSEILQRLLRPSAAAGCP